MIPDRFQYFLDDSGNFENLVKIWSRNPPNYYQNASNNTRKIMESSWKNIILSIWDTNIFENFQNLYVLGTMCFDFVWICFRCVCDFYVLFYYIFWKYFYEDEELKMIHFPLLNSTQTWIWISFLSKNMKWKSP